ncbi:Uncharacterised protein [Kluyvera cryocrescens]|uniref:Uncharacterized protein n=1 Tax=Kluyvera cryocrescens TaxID=580 RepID=A0A485ANL3_KLUCR|nr:Uncharacterised protein [Kluyvera cryocrescens]
MPITALSVGKLEDHVGHQVTFGQQACTSSVIHISTNLRGDPASQRLNTIGLITQRTELLLEQNGLQTRQMIFQTFFTVSIEEELGIRQTWTNHFFVTGDNLDRIFRFNVGNENEVWQQLARVIVNREVLLVALHGVNQRFGWNRKEFLFEFRRQNNRPFHQGGHFFQQAFAQIGVTANLARRFFSVRFDFGFTLFVVSNDFTALQQNLRVLIGICRW